MFDKITVNDSQSMQQAAQEIIRKVIVEGKTIQEAAGISATLLEDIYSIAYAYYNQGKYKEAVSLFHFLASTSPSYKFVLGLAASHHQMGSYSDAISGFLLALHIEPEDPTPAYYVADCFLRQNNLQGADDFLAVTIEMAEDKQAFSTLKERCVLIRKSLNVKK